MRKLLSILFFCLLTSSAFGTTYYVRTDGSDSNNGLTDSAGGAKLTIQAAVALATTAGDIVQVGGGTYAGSFTSAAAGTSGSKITVKNKTGETVNIPRFTINHAYNVVDGLRITAASYYASGLGGAHINASNVTIQNCTFLGSARASEERAFIYSTVAASGTQILYNTFDGQSNGEYTSMKIGIRLNANGNCRIAYNLFKDFNSFERAIEPHGTGLRIDHNESRNWNWTIGEASHPDFIQWWGTGETVEVLIENNYLHDMDAQIGNVRWSPTNNNNVVMVWRNNVFAHVTMALFNWEEMYFYNNTFYHCAANADNVILSNSYGGTAYYYNNVFVGCGRDDAFNRGWYDGYPSSGAADYNFVSTLAGAAKSGFAGDETHGINGGTTGFISALSNCTTGSCNFNIGATSSFINHGTTISSFSSDYNGFTRPSGAAWDMGAYEYEASPPGNDTTVTAAADYDTDSATVNLTGTASDSDGIASVAYVNNRGGSGACTGTTSWTCSSVTLYNGLNTITVTATDTLAYTGSDQIIVTYYQSVADQTTINTTGPQLVYFKGPASNFKITGSVNAPSESANSFYIDIDTDPLNSATAQWHLALTSGYESKDARWGTYADPDAYQSPTVWLLSGGNQILYIREREAGTLIQSVKFVAMSADSTAPAVTIATSSPQGISTDALTVTGTATDAVWGTGSVCKFRIGAEPDAGNGTACTGTTSWSCSTSGYASGANTLYIECADAVPNWPTGNSITVYYTPTAPLPPVTTRGASIGGGSFR